MFADKYLDKNNLQEELQNYLIPVGHDYSSALLQGTRCSGNVAIRFKLPFATKIC
jgi:hypothetical protein